MHGDKSKSQWWTPEWLADDAVTLLRYVPVVLEPCAGNGVITRALIKRGFNVTEVEIDSRLALVPGVSRIIADYLCVPPPKNVEGAVVMNPPYEKGAALKFVRKARAEANVVIAVLPTSFLSNRESAMDVAEAAHIRFYVGRPFRGGRHNTCAVVWDTTVVRPVTVSWRECPI